MIPWISDDEANDELHESTTNIGDLCPFCGRFSNPYIEIGCSHYQGTIIGTQLWQQSLLLDKFQTNCILLRKRDGITDFCTQEQMLEAFITVYGAVTGEGWTELCGESGCNIYVNSKVLTFDTVVRAEDNIAETADADFALAV